MKSKYLVLLILSTIIFIYACNPSKVMMRKADSYTILYEKSLQNAMSPGPNKVYSNLVSITSKNNSLAWKNINGEEYILVVAWKEDVSYFEPYLDSTYFNTGTHENWITTAPELLNRMKVESYTDPTLRLKQLLGLPPNSSYKYFVEFWVRPTDLFRPCPDNEITDETCDLCFSKNTDSLYIKWINGNRISRYYNCGEFDNYPWTQLGYTYDWNPTNTNHVGLSEFVIGKNKNIVVKEIYTTESYLQKNITP